MQYIELKLDTSNENLEIFPITPGILLPDGFALEEEGSASQLTAYLEEGVLFTTLKPILSASLSAGTLRRRPSTDGLQRSLIETGRESGRGILSLPESVKMTTPRFYVPKEKIAPQLVTIEGEELRHPRNAIRLKAGDRAEVFDGLGNLYLIELTEVGKDRALGRQVLASTHEEQPAPTLSLCQSILRGPAMDLVIQKATELGASGIYPVMTERSVVEISTKRGDDKVNRWQRIAIEASKQSKRLHIPKVFPIMGANDLKSVISSLDFTILFWEGERLETVKQIRDESERPSSIGVIIGPEGGFTEGEVDLLTGLGAKVATLGRNILKAETAAIVALAIVAREFGGDL